MNTYSLTLTKQHLDIIGLAIGRLPTKLGFAIALELERQMTQIENAKQSKVEEGKQSDEKETPKAG